MSGKDLASGNASSRKSAPQLSTELAAELGRVGAWAPGNYCCRCRSCDRDFIGDKRAMHCFPCAIKLLLSVVNDVAGDLTAAFQTIQQKELQARTRLTEALKPFGMAFFIEGSPDEDEIEIAITVGDLRRARDALLWL